MSAAHFNYFTFRCEALYPVDENAPILPPEIFSTLIQSLGRAEADYKTVVSWGLVCKFFLAECIRSCANFRTYCFFRQINTFHIAQQTENASDIVYKGSQCRRSERDGTAFFKSFKAYNCTFNVVNLRNSIQLKHYNNVQDAIHDDLGIKDNWRTGKISQSTSDCFKIANKIIIVTGTGIFFYIQSPNGVLSFERYVEAKGRVGLLNESLYLVNKEGFFKLNLEETTFSPCPADRQLSALEDRRFITTHDSLFIYEATTSKLLEIAFDEEAGLQVVGECILPAPILTDFSIYKNWLAFLTDDKNRVLYLVNLHSQEVINIGQDRKLIFYRDLIETLIMRDDVLYVQYNNNESFWFHLPSKQDITNSVVPFFNPLLKEKKRWLIDFALLYDPINRVPKLRLLLGEEKLKSRGYHKTWVVETELETAPKKDIAPNSHRCAQKTYYVAAALFLLIGCAGAVLFQVLPLNPYIQVTRDLFISLPAMAALTLGFAGFLVSLALRHYLSEKPSL